jgi:TRAP-type C4-dicarboxylate transport system permease small subunit
MKDENFEYDIQKRARAGSSAVFRVVVAAYIIYLGWTVLRGVLNGTSPVPVWVAWLVAIVFTAGAGAFLFYTWKKYLRDREDARIVPHQEQLSEEDSSEDSES